MAIEIKLPELGENITSGRIVGISVSPGDTIEKDQILLEVETDKAVIEVPAERSGLIRKILVKDGEDIEIGQTLLILEETEGTAPEAGKEVKTLPEKEIVSDTKQPASEEQILRQPEAEVPHTTEVSEVPKEVAPASPSVRRFAREIGISIHEVVGSGAGGRISIEDVKQHAKQLNRQRSASPSLFKGMQDEPLPDFSKWGRVERKAMSKVREATARHLSYAWATIPHVTQFDKADVTELEKTRSKYALSAEKAGGKLTLTAILLKVIQKALVKFPRFNASIDMQHLEVIYKEYYHIGVAVDTDRGLLVPVIRDVDRKNIIQLSVELTELSDKARSRKLSPDEMQGGNFSISNLGGIGGTAFTPIVNAPQVAILGVSRTQTEAVYLDNHFVPRKMLPLSLSYDHRLIDGADAARFLRWVCQALEEPFLLSLEG